LSGAFEQERDKAKSWEKAYYTLKEEAEKTHHKLTFSDKSREELERELAELKIDFGRAKVEIDELIRQLDIKDIKIDELQRGNKVLEQYNAQKERLLREHKNIFEKSYTNTALDQ
jgi:chromosome segregation ATPase